MSFKNPLISIVIINYNKCNFILQSIKSALNQNYKNKEIIFFDDQSTDGSLKKIKNFKKENNLKFRIVFSSKKKKKFATINHIEALKKSLKISKGEYIFLLDSDDYFKKDKISKVIETFKNDKRKKIILDQPILKFSNREYKKKFQNLLRKKKWPKFPPTSCMSFEKKNLINAMNSIDLKNYPNLAIDFRLAVYYSLILNNFYILNSHLTIYRQVKGSMDDKYKKYFSKEWWKRRSEAFEFLNELLRKNNLSVNRGIDFLLTRFFNKILNQ